MGRMQTWEWGMLWATFRKGPIMGECIRDQKISSLVICISWVLNVFSISCDVGGLDVGGVSFCNMWLMVSY